MTVFFSAAGNATFTVVPRPSSLETNIVPPQRSAIALQMASPRPTPPLDRLREGSAR
jgi:hypothetical protein